MAEEEDDLACVPGGTAGEEDWAAWSGGATLVFCFFWAEAAVAAAQAGPRIDVLTSVSSDLETLSNVDSRFETTSLPGIPPLLTRISFFLFKRSTRFVFACTRPVCFLTVVLLDTEAMFLISLRIAFDIRVRLWHESAANFSASTPSSFSLKAS